MLSLLRWSRINQLPLWGFLLLLVGMPGPFPDAAEPGTQGPARGESVSPESAAGDSAWTIEQMERLGRQMRESTPALLELITSSEASVELRRRAVLALAAVGPEEMDQARVVFDLLGDVSAELELRRTILMAFGEKDLFEPLLVPALLSIVDEPRNELLLRRQALFALGRFPETPSIAPALARVVARSTEDTQLRLAILDHLHRFDRHADVVVDTLGALVRQPDQSADLRMAVIAALRNLGPGAQRAAWALVEVVAQSSNPLPLRTDAALALGQTGWPEESSSVLVALVFEAETPAALRSNIAGLLGRMDSLPPPLPAQWLPALEDTGAPPPVRRLAARMLARADLDLPDGVELSSRLLRDPKEDPAIRAHAAEFLRRLGVRAGPARATLEAVLLNTDAPVELREAASTALAQVAQAWLDQPDELDRTGLNQRLSSLDHTLQIMEQAGLRSPPHPQNMESVRRVRDILRAEKESRWFSRLGDWAEAHPIAARWWVVLASAGAGLLLLAMIWWTLARVAPLYLGRLQEALDPYEVVLPGWLGGGAFGARHVSLLCCWSRDERVANAWVGFLQPAASESLAQHRRAMDAEKLVEIPVEVDGRSHSTAPLDWILSALSKPGACLAITGEAGTGKTSLALRTAARACAVAGEISEGNFIPVWVDATRASDELIEVVRGELHAAARSAPPSAHLIRALLRCGRIVLVLDGVSEWPAADRDRVLSVVAQLGQPSMLITTRDAPAGRTSMRLRLPRLNGAAATGFISAFLEQAAVRADSPNLLAAGRYWTELVAGRSLPVDAVRLYAEYLLETRAEVSIDRPENLLDLVRRLIGLRNARAENRMPDDVVLRLAGQLAWACVRHGGSIGMEAIPESLNRETLAYLEEQTGLIRANPKTGRVWFARDTLADLLAAGYLIDTCGNDGQAWERLRDTAASGGLSGDKVVARLGEAIWTACYRSSDPFASVPIPEVLHATLEQQMTRTGSSSGDVNPRARQLVQLVLAPENSDRTRAIEALAALGRDAGPAIPELLEALGNQTEDLEIRHAVLAALALLGRHAMDAKTALLGILEDRKEHLFLRVKAIDTLLRVAPADPATGKLLVDRAGDPAEVGLLRSKAGQAAATLERSRDKTLAPAAAGAG